MKRKRANLAAEDDAEATLVEPRFDEEAKEAARPVVPLSQVRSSDLYGGAQAGGPRAISRYGGSGWPHSIAIMLAVFAIAAVVTATVIYRSARTPAPAAAPQTINETRVEPEPQTVERAPEPAAVERAPARESSSATSARENGTKENGTAAQAEPAREAEPRVVAPARAEIVNRVGKDDERRARDEEKPAERARKEEKKQAKREEKEAERMAEKQRDEGKREEVRPRLVGIYTEGRKH
jgi:hypothetical protein